MTKGNKFIIELPPTARVAKIGEVIFILDPNEAPQYIDKDGVVRELSLTHTGTLTQKENNVLPQFLPL